MEMNVSGIAIKKIKITTSFEKSITHNNLSTSILSFFKNTFAFPTNANDTYPHQMRTNDNK